MFKTHHVVRDLYSGARVANPLSKRDAPAHAKNFRHFVGLRANELATKTLIKLDEAGELEQAAHQVGFIPETSLPNRWPHNACWKGTSGRRRNAVEQSTFNQGYRMSFIPIRTHLRACQCPQTGPSITNPEKTQWESITRSPFDGIRLCFGQLMYYRRIHPTKKTLEPNMAPGLFMGVED